MLKKEIDNDDLYSALLSTKETLELDLDIQNLDNQCFEVNNILNKHRLFITVYELKDKFWALTIINSNKNNILRQVSSCLTKKFNGFRIVSIEQEKKNWKTLRPVDIIYKPVKQSDELINCYFSSRLNFGFQGQYTERNNVNKIKFCTSFQCYYCSNYYSRKGKYDRHIENCAGHPGIIFNFITHNVITFEDDLKYKGDIPLVAYIDFETTAPTDDSLDPQSKKMYAAPYVIIFAFHPKLKLCRVIIERSFRYSEKELTSLNYLTREQLSFKDNKTLLQLKDCTLNVLQ